MLRLIRIVNFSFQVHKSKCALMHRPFEWPPFARAHLAENDATKSAERSRICTQQYVQPL